MNRRLQILYVLIFICSTVAAQNQAANWYFGLNAGLTFNTNPVTALNGGAILSTEGSAAVSTADGKLLFYTDGRTIWNKDHKVMVNGSGLLGSSNTTQSAIIVPKPDSKNIYYVFTLDQLGGFNGLHYSEVDVAAEGGLGRVTNNKNVSLKSSSLSEKLTAIRHGNGKDYWVLVHGNNNQEFYAFEVTESGVSKTEITSSVGSIHPNIFGTMGYMKFSPDGKKVACAVGGTGNFVELLDFNDLTGELSNPMKLDFTAAPYGIEFSPDSKRLYVSSGINIYQYSIPSIINSSLLSLSEKIIKSDANIWGLQLGIDKKIYACKQGNKLAVINEPNNTVGNEDFKDNFITLTNTAVQGLPNQLQNYFNEYLIDVENACANQPANFKVLLNEPDSIQWSFDGVNFISSLTPQYTFHKSGTYTVKAKVYTGSYYKELTRRIVIEDLPSFTLGPDTILCKGQYLSYNFSIDNAKYLWNNGKTHKYRTISTPGVHYLDVTAKGCTVRDSVTVKYNFINPSFSINNQEQCLTNNTFKFTCTTPGVETTDWYIDNVYFDDAKSTQTSFQQIGLYKIRLEAKSKNGCVDSVVKEVKVKESPVATFTVKANNTCGKNNSYTFTNTTQFNDNNDFEFLIEGTSIVNKKDVTWTFSTIGEHEVELIVTTETGCESRIKKKITVYPAPDATFSVATNSACLNDNSFTIQFEGKLRLFETLSWKIDDVPFTPSNNTFVKSFTTAGKHTISAKISSNSGCVEEIVKDIEVFENPVTDFTTAINSFNCLGTNGIEFKNLTTSSTPIINYNWSFGDNTSSSDENPLKSYASQSQYVLSLEATNEAGCSHKATKTINTYEQPDVEINTKIISACENDNAFEVSFTNNNSSASIANIIWETSDGTPVPSQNPAPLSFTKKGDYILNLKVETVFGCKDEASTEISVTPLPTGDFAVNYQEQCLVDNRFELTAPKNHNGIKINSYKWDLAGASSILNDNVASLNFKNIGNFDVNVEVIDENGCKAKLYKKLTVHPMPEFKIEKTTGCVNVPVTLKAKGLSQFIVVDTWDWGLGDGTTSSSANPINTYNRAAAFDISATAISENGCKHTETLNEGVVIYSNPIADFEYKKVIWNFKETVLEFEANSSISTNNFTWDFGNGQTGNKLYERVDYTDAGYYNVSLTATTDKGCIGKATKRILIVPPFDAYVPTSFTPNGDGINDVFGMEGVEFINAFQMQIFDRWGQEIFRSNRVDLQWNGKYNDTPMPPGIYTYAINISDAEGRPYEINGTIQLIR